MRQDVGQIFGTFANYYYLCTHINIFGIFAI